MMNCKNRYYYFLIISLLISIIGKNNIVKAQAAKSVNIYGTIIEDKTGETISGVTVSVDSKEAIVISNSYGYYSINLKVGTHTLNFEHVSFKTLIKTITVTQSEKLNITLSPGVNLLEKVVLKGGNNRDAIRSTQMSRVDLKIDQLKRIPSVSGEPDLLKAIQLLPGVNTANEGSTNLNVRGGSYDQNLILLDEAPVYNPSHALGFFSTFNADAIRNVTFYKGAFPAEYGGRLSSVINVYMKEGNNQDISMEGGIGIIASRLTYQQPIKKVKSSFLISGRYSYAGQTVNLLGNFGQNVLNLHGLQNFVDRNNIYFYDFNTKINFELSTKDKLYISGYSGRDKFYSYAIDESNNLKWGNTTSTIRWNHIFNPRLFSNTSLIFSNYNYSYFSLVDAKSFIWKSNINLLGLKSDYDLFLNNNHKLKFGIASYYSTYQPGRIEQKDTSSIIRSVKLDNKTSLDISLYLSDEIRLSTKASLQLGLRYTNFLNIGPAKVFTYNPDFSVIDSAIYKKGDIINNYKSFEPRVSFRYLLPHDHSIKLSYAKTKQFLHLISNSSVGLPTDVWIPADSYIKPQEANQLAVGYFRNIINKTIELSVEAYYKISKNTIDYRDNANLFLNPKLETQVLPGNGRSYGIELLLDKKIGKIKGWLSYTWSNTSLKINGVNNNKRFPARYDIRNNLAITSTYEYNKRLLFAATFKLTSGGHVTVPVGDFTYFGTSYSYYSSRNGFTLPAYHRLDISASLKSKKYVSQKLKKEWVFSLFNFYNRKNIYALFIKPDPIYLDRVKAFNFYLYGIVPSVTLNFKLR